MAEVVFFFSRPVASELLSMPRHGGFEQLTITERKFNEKHFVMLQSFSCLILEEQLDSKESERNNLTPPCRMTVFDYVSSVGGILGLCMGFSIISLIEILYWLTIGVGEHVYRLSRQHSLKQKSRVANKYSVNSYVECGS